MGSNPPPKMPVVETTPPNEYFVTDIGKIESVGGSCLKFYLCAVHDNALEVKAVLIMPMASVLNCARQAMQAVGDFHNVATMIAPSETVN